MKEPELFKKNELESLTTTELHQLQPLTPHASDRSAHEMCYALKPGMKLNYKHGAQAKIQHLILIQNESLEVRGLSQVNLDLEENAKLSITLIQAGSEKFQAQLCVRLQGRGASIRVQGVQFAGGKQLDSQKLFSQVQISHDQPETESELQFLCLGQGRSQSIFSGEVSIQKGARGSVAYQKNKNLILSEQAVVHSFPKLFIENDEVKAAHGSSTSSLDEEHRFYLESRGINRKQAETMMIEGTLKAGFSLIESEPHLKLAYSAYGLTFEKEVEA